MADPPHRSLPDEITIWEILVRLPPKSLLRCRAVCRAWRSATSARRFLLAHHALQPTLPLLYGFNFVGDEVQSLDIIPFHQRAGAGQLQLRPVARLEQDSDFHHLEACCDGLLVLSFRNTSVRDWRFAVCNPATRQYAPLPMAYGSGVEYSLLGMYPHIPTGDYRLLMYRASALMHGELVPAAAQDGSYIFTLGSGQPPMHIGFLDAEVLTYTFGSLLFRGSLHWRPPGNMIMVFDTTTELFRQMRAPVVLGHAKLFQMDEMLGMSGFNDGGTTIDIWMAQDYERGVWACKYRVEFSVADLTLRFGKFDGSSWVVAVPWDGDVLLLVNFGEWLLHVDIGGKLVATFHRKGLGPANLQLKQTLVQHTFFPTLEGYVANSAPFI
ncbi:F-box protein At5g49610 [Aegilops tauschii subsp. strangulata]|nr:F-box protein At5g49610 [Aegilops tauschii subsp. strangulata]